MQTFRDYMETALYDAQGGFYARRTSRNDFYTAPELHPVFARLLAGELVSRLTVLAEREPETPLLIVEMGSGDGTLARQVIGAIRDLDPGWLPRARYVLVERIEALLLKSIASLKGAGLPVMGYTRLVDLPEFHGALFSNELVDAFPVHVLEKRGGAVRELYVREVSGGGGCALTGGELSHPDLATDARAVAETLPEGGRHAVSLEARSWMRGVAAKLKAGPVITVDYGKRFAACAPNPPRTFERHSIGDDITGNRGGRDITASVDFEKLVSEGEGCGLKTAWYGTLSRFLLDRGVLDRLPKGDDTAAFRERAQMKTLFHPEGMGETFKVLIQERV